MARDDTTTADDERKKTNILSSGSPVPSVTVSLFVFWILPVLLMAIFGRFILDDSPPEIKIPKNTPASVKLGGGGDRSPSSPSSIKSPSSSPTASRNKNFPQPSVSSPTASSRSSVPTPKQPTPSKKSSLPSAHTYWPTSYTQVLKTVNKRKRRTPRYKSDQGKPSSSVKDSGTTTTTKAQRSKWATARNDGAGGTEGKKYEVLTSIDARREEALAKPNDVIRLINLAESLRMYDVTFHDGGTKQSEALATYEKAIQMLLAQRKKLLDEGEPTNMSLSATQNVPAEVLMDYSSRSVDGKLCGVYTGKGKVYFMANMFERAVESYTLCLQIEPLYLDALSSRGSSRLILGKYEEAGSDFMKTIANDEQALFTDIYTGLARILSAKEEAVPGGWDFMLARLDNLLPRLEGFVSSKDHSSEANTSVLDTLNRLHHVMFTYHDVKTKDTDMAWHHLSLAYKHKMKRLPKWNSNYEQTKIEQTKQIFRKGFWPPAVGSNSKVPIFIIGYVRSGSTLLERVLDAHPQVVGTGEDSVFNGRLEEIRNRMVEVSISEGSRSGDPSQLMMVVRELATSVVDEMRDRWEIIDANTAPSEDEDEDETAKRQRIDPECFVDKMLNNYYNVGFIHMLFPNALILHVIREPMDTLFSAYKHEFPPGTLDYTSDFSSLADMYRGYRELMDHWDRELPGRITHVRYEDMVNDMPGVAKAVIKAAGLDWSEDVLKFHTKKHAVNTLSTTQVRQGVYKHSMKSWMKYENELKPLVNLVGDLATTNRRTTLPKYRPPVKG